MGNMGWEDLLTRVDFVGGDVTLFLFEREERSTLVSITAKNKNLYLNCTRTHVRNKLNNSWDYKSDETSIEFPKKGTVIEFLQDGSMQLSIPDLPIKCTLQKKGGSSMDTTQLQ